MPTIRGTVREFGWGDARRPYVVHETTFGEARKLFRPEVYSAANNKGEQRAVLPTHARYLRSEMERGEFTPTAVHAGLRPRHAKAMQKSGREVKVTLEDGDMLPLTNGGHRMKALELVREDAEKALAAAKTDGERHEAQLLIEETDDQPLTFFLTLDCDCQKDFLNLQKSRAVDAAHMMSLKVGLRMAAKGQEKVYELAFAAAKLLNTNSKSPFSRNVRFDSSGHAGYPISSLCPRGVGDHSASMLGLAKVGIAFGRKAEWLAYAVVTAVRAIESKNPDLLANERLLTPPPNGTKGAACLLIGVATALAYRVASRGGERADERDLGSLVDAAKETLDHPVCGNLAAPLRRAFMGGFCRELFADVKCDKHEGIPVGLLKIIPPSAFNAAPLPKAGPRGKAKAAAQTPAPGPQATQEKWDTVGPDEPPGDAEATAELERAAG